MPCHNVGARLWHDNVLVQGWTTTVCWSGDKAEPQVEYGGARLNYSPTAISFYYYAPNNYAQIWYSTHILMVMWSNFANLDFTIPLNNTSTFFSYHKAILPISSQFSHMLTFYTQITFIQHLAKFVEICYANSYLLCSPTINHLILSDNNISF